MDDGPVLVVAAHPDDEVLMCGGAIARHATAGSRVDILFVADGESARFAVPDDPAATGPIQARKRAAARAATILGARPPRYLDLPDNRLDSIPLLDIVKLIEAAVADCAPRRVYTHFAGDLNIDHVIVHRAVVTACRPMPGRTVRTILAGETLSSSEWGVQRCFRPNRYIGLGEDVFLERKIEALRAYGGEIPSAPHPRSLEAIAALARVRGAEVGLDLAEAFEVVREIEQ